MKSFKEFINEDGMAGGIAGPTNAVSSGAIAGTGGKGGEPGVNLRKKKSPDPRIMAIVPRKPPSY